MPPESNVMPLPTMHSAAARVSSRPCGAYSSAMSRGGRALPPPDREDRAHLAALELGHVEHADRQAHLARHGARLLRELFGREHVRRQVRELARDVLRLRDHDAAARRVAARAQILAARHEQRQRGDARASRRSSRDRRRSGSRRAPLLPRAPGTTPDRCPRRAAAPRARRAPSARRPRGRPRFPPPRAGLRRRSPSDSPIPQSRTRFALRRRSG